MLKLKFVLEALDRATATVKSVNRVVNSIIGPARRVKNALGSMLDVAGAKKLKSALSDIGNHANGVTASIRNIRNALFMVAAIGIGAALPIKHIVDEAGAINDMAATLGITAQQLQRVAYALTLDGSSVEDAANSLKFLQQNAVAALTGSKEMQLWFRRAGISLDFLRKNLKDPNALLEALADGLARTDTPAKRLAISKNLLAKSSSRVVQTLARGSVELKKFGKEAEELGAVLDNETVAAMDEAGDSITRAERSLKGVLASIAVAALPAIREITSGIIQWAKANRELIATKATVFFRELVANLPAFVEGLKSSLSAVRDIAVAVNAVAQFFGGWKVVMAALATILAAKVVISVIMLTKALATLGIVLLTTPLGWFLGAIALIAGAAFLVYKNWTPIKEFFKNLWAGVVDAFNSAINWISEKIRAVVGWVEDLVLKLDQIAPAWVKRLTPHGMLLDAAAGNIRARRANVSSGVLAPQRAQVGGLLRIQIDGSGRPSVRELRSDNRDVPIEVGYGSILELSR